MSGVGCRVSGVGCRVSGVGCRVQGVRVQVRPQEQDVPLVQFGRVLPFDYWNGLAEPRTAAITTASAGLQGVVV